MKWFICSVLLVVSGTMALAQNAVTTEAGTSIEKTKPDAIPMVDHQHKLSPLAKEQVHEQSRDVLEAARELEETTHLLQKDKCDSRHIKQQIERLYFQLYLLDKTIPGKPIVPAPFKKKKAPATIDFGTTAPINKPFPVILHPKNKDYRPTATIKITNTGGRSRYIRILQIEVTTVDKKVIKLSELLKRGLYEKVNAKGTYSFTFKEPVKIKVMSITISHETNGLKVWTIPVGK